MQIKVGTDILDKKRFIKSAKNGGTTFLEKIFTPQEIRENTVEQLASIFSLKEAVVKALEKPKGFWLNISTHRNTEGKINYTINDLSIAEKIKTLDGSISHEGNLIIAVTTIIMEK